MMTGKSEIQYLIRIAGWLAGLWLGGVTSCSPEKNVDYASSDIPPTVHYVISGTVVSEKDVRVGIPDLQVVISRTDPHPAADTCITGKQGEFAWNNPVTTFGKDLVFTITVTDINGDKDRFYAPYTTHISFSRDELDNEVSWFLGEGKKEVLIKMKELDHYYRYAGMQGMCD
jgi:putative lipoprotein (rSAM/lipoprotein system)